MMEEEKKGIVPAASNEPAHVDADSSLNEDIPDELFKRANVNASELHDQAFETKPVSFLKGAIKRFAKNKASIVATIIIGLIVLYAIIVPFVSPKNYVNSTEYPSGFQDANFAYVLPYNPLFKGTGFWDGTKTESGVGRTQYTIYKYDDSNHAPLVETISVDEAKVGSSTFKQYTVRLDTYAVGNKTIRIQPSEYERLVAYEKEQGIYQSEGSIMKPFVDYETYLSSYREEMLAAMADDSTLNETLIDQIVDYMRTYYNQNGRIYYQLTSKTSNGSYSQNNFSVVLDENGEPIPIYQKDADGNYVYSEYTSGVYTVRVDYFDYFTFHNGFEPYFVFGTNGSGQDIFLRLALGARFSLLLGIGITLVNFIIGLIFGAISGYYGGTIDLVMERVTDIISCIPSIIILTVCSIQFTNNISLSQNLGTAGVYILAFLVAFVFSGWIGTAGTTRMQFYRFKGQEYVLASRTLGAKDRRLIFKHILPNAAGTLVTSSVLMVPSVIFGESSLSYLGIINFTTSGLCSIGSLLNEGSNAGLSTYPHVLLFPCIVISLLMISFNLFGNGLRDAFNTTLRGSE